MTVLFPLAYWAYSVAAQPPLTLMLASDKASYDSTEVISITATLTNVSLSPLTVSALAFGNVSFKVKKDGTSVSPKKLQWIPGMGPQVAQARAIVNLTPNQSVSFPVRVSDSYGSRAVAELRTGGKDKATNVYKLFVYQVAEPGLYTLTATYKYRDKTTTAYHGKLVSNTLTFKVD